MSITLDGPTSKDSLLEPRTWGDLWPLIDSLPEIRRILRQGAHYWLDSDGAATTVSEFTLGDDLSTAFRSWYISHGDNSTTSRFLLELRVLLENYRKIEHLLPNLDAGCSQAKANLLNHILSEISADIRLGRLQLSSLTIAENPELADALGVDSRLGS